MGGDFERVRFEIASFVTWYEDFIFGQLTGETVDELDELFYEDRNALFWGGEISLGVDLFELCGGTVGTEWQFDYVRARFTDGSGDRNVPRITPMRWGGSLVYQHDLVKGSFGFLRHESQWDPSDAELATNSFTMLDLTLQVRLPFLENVVETDLWFTASNLLDEAARNAVSFTKDEVRLPGRTFRVGVRTSF